MYVCLGLTFFVLCVSVDHFFSVLLAIAVLDLVSLVPSQAYHPSVLLHCWLGHLTCKIVSEMTYNVSSGTLNPTIYSIQYQAKRLAGKNVSEMTCQVGHKTQVI